MVRGIHPSSVDNWTESYPILPSYLRSKDVKCFGDKAALLNQLDTLDLLRKLAIKQPSSRNDICPQHDSHRVLHRVALCCVVLCCVVLCCVVLCCAVLRSAVFCCVVLHCVVLCCVALCCVVLCCAVLRCAVFGCVVLRCSAFCCVVLCRAVLHNVLWVK